MHYNLGLCYFKKEKYNKAVEYMTESIRLSPNNLYAYNNLAFIYNFSQKYEEAIEVGEVAKNNNQNIDNLCFRHSAFAYFKLK